MRGKGCWMSGAAARTGSFIKKKEKNTGRGLIYGFIDTIKNQ